MSFSLPSLLKPSINQHANKWLRDVDLPQESTLWADLPFTPVALSAGVANSAPPAANIDFACHIFRARGNA
jgi:hypothetical protein